MPGVSPAPISMRRSAVPGVSLTEQAYRALEEQIVTLKIAPGTVVSEAILGQRLGIGRTPIREALWRLARERLVTIIPHRGIIVSEINIKLQLRLLELRRVVGRLASRPAPQSPRGARPPGAQRGTPPRATPPRVPP